MELKYFKKAISQGITNASEDYSGGPTSFVLCPENHGQKEIWIVHELMIFIGDTDSDHNKFGNLPALANGMLLRHSIYQDSANILPVKNILGDLPIKQTSDIMRSAGVIRSLNSSAGATVVTQGVIKPPLPLTMYSQNKDCLEWLLNDDLQLLPELYLAAWVETRLG